MDILIAGGNATSYSLGHGSAIDRGLGAKNVVVRDGVYNCDWPIYTAMCKYMEMRGLDVSNYFVVFQHKHDSRAWIDASIELPVELDGMFDGMFDGIVHASRARSNIRWNVRGNVRGNVRSNI